METHCNDCWHLDGSVALSDTVHAKLDHPHMVVFWWNGERYTDTSVHAEVCVQCGCSAAQSAHPRRRWVSPTGALVQSDGDGTWEHPLMPSVVKGWNFPPLNFATHAEEHVRPPTQDIYGVPLARYNPAYISGIHHLLSFWTRKRKPLPSRARHFLTTLMLCAHRTHPRLPPEMWCAILGTMRGHCMVKDPRTQTTCGRCARYLSKGFTPSVGKAGVTSWTKTYTLKVDRGLGWLE
jgi:hypothetical protein